MARLFLLRSLIATLATAASLGACASGGAAGNGDEQDVTAKPACQVFSAQLGRMLEPAELAKLNDPIAKQILGAPGCATKYDDIADKFGKCGDQDPLILETALVSERTFLLGHADPQTRGVVSRNCGNEGAPFGANAFLSLFGIDTNQPSLPQDGTEVIGFDQTAGVYDFYVHENDRWTFMGNSNDALAEGYDCDANGACEPKAAAKTRCFACHESGGLNMKELNSPWTNWDSGDAPSPGTAMPDANRVFQKFSKLKARGTASALEGAVEGGNHALASARRKKLMTMGTKELLRPLFCTISMQLGVALGDDAVAMPDKLMVTPLPQGDPQAHDIGFTIASIPQIASADYRALLLANGQKIVDGSAKQLSGTNGPVVDTLHALTFPFMSDVDRAYIGELLDQKLIDHDFVQDVIAIDFTRPVLSPTRCALLEAAPMLAPADTSPEAIVEGFKANLASPIFANLPDAADLLANLQAVNDGSAHQKRVDAYITACSKRPAKDYFADVLKYQAHLLAAVKAHRTNVPGGGQQGFIEFPETLPVNDLPDTHAAFDPVDCTLK